MMLVMVLRTMVEYSSAPPTFRPQKKHGKYGQQTFHTGAVVEILIMANNNIINDEGGGCASQPTISPLSLPPLKWW
jgi:hypothetical protein